MAIHWSGKQSPILAGISGGGARSIDRRPDHSGRAQREPAAADRNGQPITDEIAADGGQVEGESEREAIYSLAARLLMDEEEEESVTHRADPADSGLAHSEDETEEQPSDPVEPADLELPRSENENEEQPSDHAEPADPGLPHFDDEHGADPARPADSELVRILAHLSDETEELAPTTPKPGVIAGIFRKGMGLFRRRG